MVQSRSPGILAIGWNVALYIAIVRVTVVIWDNLLAVSGVPYSTGSSRFGDTEVQGSESGMGSKTDQRYESFEKTYRSRGGSHEFNNWLDESCCLVLCLACSLWEFGWVERCAHKYRYIEYLTTLVR